VFLDLDYAPLEIVVVDDGSKDETFARLDQAFDLVPLPLGGTFPLETALIRSLHVSRKAPALRVVRKENGGRSDAINAGVCVARGELVAVTDADSLMEPDAIRRAVRPFEVHPDDCVAVGGTIRIANGSRIVDGRVEVPHVSTRGLAATQVLEYLRGFLGTRIAWSEINGLLIVSGAFGVFRRDLLVALGGFSDQTLGEDMEMTMRFHHRLRPRWRSLRVEYTPDAVCWTEAPSTMGGLRNQRVRWHVGLLDNLRMHAGMFGRTRFGAAGTIAFPYMVLFEALAPLVEFLGYAIVITLIILDAASWPYLVLFFLVAVLVGQVLNVTALLIEEVGFRRYSSRDLLRMGAWGLIEALWLRRIVAWWRTKATVLALFGRRPGWGTIPRGEGILEQPAEVVAPLTR
jgi:cellulose synthase/poly-beta-1,6-N-acetylglucosamine synthase-like glycosyltransferase